MKYLSPLAAFVTFAAFSVYAIPTNLPAPGTKSVMVRTNGVLDSSSSNLFSVNIQLLTNSLTAAGFSSGSGGVTNAVLTNSAAISIVDGTLYSPVQTNQVTAAAIAAAGGATNAASTNAASPSIADGTIFIPEQTNQVTAASIAAAGGVTNKSLQFQTASIVTSDSTNFYGLSWSFGNATTDAGGDTILYTGASKTNAATGVAITLDSARDVTGGSIQLSAGQSSGADAGGTITISGGGNSLGGAIQLASGNTDAGGVQAVILISGANGVTPGAISMTGVINGNGAGLTNIPLAAINANLETSDSEALRYISLAGVREEGAKNDLKDFFAGQKNSLAEDGASCYSHLAGAFVTYPRMGAGNNLDLFGNSYAVVNGKFSNWSASFDNTNGIRYVLPNTVTQFTAVVVFRLDGHLYLNHTGQGDSSIGTDSSLVFSLENTNDASGAFMSHLPYNGGIQTTIKAGTNWPYGTTNFLDCPSGNASNAWWSIAALDTKHIIPVHRSVLAWSYNGTGLSAVWNNTLPCYAQAARLTYQSPVYSNSPFQILNVGVSTNWNSVKGSFIKTTNWNSYEDFAAVLIYNIASTNIVYSAYRDLRKLEQSKVDYVCIGDSLFVQGTVDLKGFCQAYTNDPFYRYSRTKPKQPCFMNFSQGGATLASMKVNAKSGAAFPNTWFTNTPTNVTTVIIPDIGRNDYLVTNADHTTSTNVSFVFDPYLNAGAELRYVQTYPVVTNGGFVNLSSDVASNLMVFNNFLKKKPGISKLYSMYPLYSQSALLNTSVSKDGVHQYVTSTLNDAWVKSWDGPDVGVTSLYPEAPQSITFPATTVPFTNFMSCPMTIYIDNTGVTGTVLSRNGVQLYGTAIPGTATLTLNPGDYFSQTYTVGTPTAVWCP